jgi:CubicO group peptidase (beta-lactamase class C family)
VGQLLNHTSGIPSFTDLGARWTRRWSEALPPDSLVAMTAG